MLKLPTSSSYPSCVIHDADSQTWWLFENLINLYETHHHEEIIPLLSKVEKDTLLKKHYAAGFISFDAASAFDVSLDIQRSSDFPLLWFGIYSKISAFSYCKNYDIQYQKIDYPFHWKPSVSKNEYKQSLKKIKTYIEQGDIYQVNYTFFLNSEDTTISSGASPANYLMSELDQYPYSAGIFTQDWDIYSASPELFFKKNGEHIVSKPMKGTQPRGLWFEQDKDFRSILQTSEKQRAENLMIVDMVRNDLGKIAKWGTVKVDQLFELNKYPNQWQMTSQVSCMSKAGLVDIFKAMFPAASITGAPKTRAVEIIKSTEKFPRGLYTGSLGFVLPNNRVQFNVAIRTLFINKKNNTMKYGTGSGIVWDSCMQTEWEECFNKTQVLTKKRNYFQLLESILWEPKSGFFLLNAHLERVLNSAKYFSIDVSFENILKKLNGYVKNMNTESKIRLLISSEGEICMNHSPISLLKRIDCVGLAKKPIDPKNIFLYHKTTQREMYEKELNEPKEVDDLIFWNKKGEITESSIGNVAVKINGELITPPISCGLLPGVYRAKLLREGILKEKIISKQTFCTCLNLNGGHENKKTIFYLLNSVQKLWEVKACEN